MNQSIKVIDSLQFHYFIVISVTWSTDRILIQNDRFISIEQKKKINFSNWFLIRDDDDVVQKLNENKNGRWFLSLFSWLDQFILFEKWTKHRKIRVHSFIYSLCWWTTTTSDHWKLKVCFSDTSRFIYIVNDDEWDNEDSKEPSENL